MCRVKDIFLIMYYLYVKASLSELIWQGNHFCLQRKIQHGLEHKLKFSILLVRNSGRNLHFKFEFFFPFHLTVSPFSLEKWLEDSLQGDAHAKRLTAEILCDHVLYFVRSVTKFMMWQEKIYVQR